MAIFQKRYEHKVTLDDTQTISCLIETAQNVNGHTEYVLKLQRGHLKENSWRILKRYNDFVALHKCLQISDVFLPLPGKKIIGNMRPEFIAERRLALQEYINIVLMNPILASSLPTKKFVDPESYNQSFHEIAVQNASLCLRTESLYVLGVSHGPIGWRIRKHYFSVSTKTSNAKGSATGQISGKHLVKTSSQSHSKHFSITNNGAHSIDASTSSSVTSPTSGELYLTWTEYGPDKFIEDKEVYNIFKSIAAILHPYIHPIEYIATNDCGALLIRKFNNAGSIKDLICGSQPKHPFLSKYGNSKHRNPLPLKDVAMYGRQILEALRFLHSKGIPFGHIHAGNIIIVDGVARLVDIENFVMGVPSFYRPFFVQHSKISSAELIDVYSFGHLLYEMVMGYPLHESILRSIECSESLKNLLESILSKEACKVGLPTLDQLATHKFFAEYAPKFNELNTIAINQNKPHLKFSTSAKEQIKIVVQKTEQKLRDEQKSVKNQKRLVRVQEMMSSEEEMKKNKHKAKLEQKQSRLRQQNSLQLNNGKELVSSSNTMPRSDSTQSVLTPQDLLSPPPMSSGNSPSQKLLTSPPPHQSYPTTPPEPPTTSTSMPTPPAPPPPPPMSPSQTTDLRSENSMERSALFNSICGFNKSALRKVASSD